MASVTSWMRLEPLPRTGDLETALEARTADPLWLLARQWQTLEFGGEDAGSPIVARIAARTARLTTVATGPDGDGQVTAIDDLAAPLEATIESEPHGLDEIERLRVESGLHFLRLLRTHDAQDATGVYVDHYGFTPGEEPTTLRGAGFRALAAGRAPDGARLFADLARHRGDTAALIDLPDTPDVPGALHERVLAACNDWLYWHGKLLVTPPPESAWESRHMEYSFAVAADTVDGQTVLSADEYTDGHLDWHAFSRRPDLKLAPFDRGSDPGSGPGDVTIGTEMVRTVIPTPASYSGMPVDRFWQFEDSRISFGSVDVGPSDLTRLVLMEFALVYGNDWFVVPVDVPVGSLCTITALDVTDTFGVTTRIGQIRPGDRWAMFELTTTASFSGSAPAAGTPLFVPPTLATTLDGDPIESVVLLRDEMANMVWGVEQTVQTATGDVVDRREQRGDERGLQQLDGDPVDAELVYRLATPVPDHWIPFVPVPASDASGDETIDSGVVLERRIMRRMTAGGPLDLEPQGKILEPGRPLRVEEEEVPREGAVITRGYQLARWSDGSTHVWLGRSKRPGRGEGRSGLRFDVVERPDPAQT